MIEPAPAWSSLTLAEVAEEMKSLGEPPYHARQFFDATHRQGVWHSDELTGLSKDLRQRMGRLRPWRTLEVSADETSTRDGTNKVLFLTSDGGHMESVLMRTGGSRRTRHTVCVSSQIGCPAACSFCASGLGGFVRNLSVAEIVDQVEFFAGRLRAQGERLDNVVYMGMGEPLLNYGPVVQSLSLLHDPDRLGLGARRITVSTVGIVPAMRKFTKDAGEVNLAVSLHAPNDELRGRLVPYNRRFPIADILGAARDHAETTGRRVSFEYVLLRRTNDQSYLAVALAQLLRPFGGLAHVNLIPWNPFGEAEFGRATKEAAEAFAVSLRRGGVNATVRYSRGLDIDAACGQLRNRLEIRSRAS